MAVAPKPIETVWNGFRFRSRLEARWAVFFDTLGIPYDYEKEGYDLGDAGWYLPDFWLPTWNRWIEIKPESPTEPELHKMAALVNATGFRALLLSGRPWPREHHIAVFNLWQRGDERAVTVESNPPYNQFAECRRCDGICLLYDETVDEKDWWPIGHCDVGPHTCGDHERPPLSAHSDHAPRVKAAYTAARQARFEHGDKR